MATHKYRVTGPPGFLANALPRRMPDCTITEQDDGSVLLVSPTKLDVDRIGPATIELTHA